MKLKTGDKVIVISGKNKGKQGKITKVLKDTNRVIVEGINIVKKHMKPKANNEQGGIIEREAPINASNVMILDPKTGKQTKIKYDINKDNKKIRIAKKSGQKLD
ncbi:MAG: 50S ribosomal protein L24 [Bacilli bacterium]